MKTKKKWRILETQLFGYGGVHERELARIRERYKGKAQVRTYGRVIKAGGAKITVTVVVVRREEVDA